MKKALSLLGAAHFPGGRWGWRGLMLVTWPWGAWSEGRGFAHSRTRGVALAPFPLLSLCRVVAELQSIHSWQLF